MEANQILHANLLDIVFENRNQQYGAYELRKNYSRRTAKALIISLISVAALICITGFKKTNKILPQEKARQVTIVSDITEVPKPIVEPPPPPPVSPDPPPPTRTVEFVTIVVAPDDDHTEPIATTEELVNSQISDVTTEGGPDDHIAQPPVMTGDGDRGIVLEKQRPTEPATNVDVQARFIGDWVRFLTKNLNANVGLDNGAPSAQHRVIIEFVVDVDGSMSMIKALTNIGYGMEEEAIRVIKKAGKWQPAIQQGQPVKAFRRQVITFDISGDE
ncbi:MAG: energy transducer TonB [Chitinophagaceae bacterium]